MGAVRFDIEIDRRSQFYKEIDISDESGNPIDLSSLTIVCTIRESLSTQTNLFQLTVANGGVIMLDAVNGKVALYIESSQTDVDAEHGVYDIVQEDPAYPLFDNFKLMYGLVTFNKGLT